MKKLILLITAPFAFLSVLIAQVTQEEADKIVLERMSQATQSHTIYAQKDVQTGMIITTSAGEELELDYACWVYYISYIRETDNAGYYLIVNENNGNLLEIKAKKDICLICMYGWKRVVTGYDCSKDELFYYATGEKKFLDDHNLFLNNCLHVGYSKQAQDSEIIDYINQTGLFKPVGVDDFLPKYSEYPSLFVYTKENKTCSQLKEIILTLESADIIAYASLTFGALNEPDLTYSNEFLVKVKDKNDLSDLYAVMQETNTRIIRRMLMEDWYILCVDKNSMGNAIQISHYFYETGRFIESYPSFLAPAYPN